MLENIVFVYRQLLGEDFAWKMDLSSTQRWDHSGEYWRYDAAMDVGQTIGIGNLGNIESSKYIYVIYYDANQKLYDIKNQ